MEDFNALAATLGAGIADARSCLILSSDGLVLGAHPESAEADARPARVKLASIGEPERGFLQFGTEVWCFVRRGPYAALAVTGTSVRPGLVMDQMEQVLLAAEDSRARREGLKPEVTPPSAPTSRPRTTFHREPRPIEEPPPVVITSEPFSALGATARAGEPRTDFPQGPPADRGRSSPDPDDPKAERPTELEGGPHSEPDPDSRSEPESPAPRDPWKAGGQGEDVDRFSLAREFSRLLQDDQDPADG